MTFEQIMHDLKNKIYKPIYFLMGEEPYYIDEITNYIAKNVLAESEKSFNQIVMYGKDTDITLVDNTARRFPMMANHQVIIIKEAQNIKKIEDLQYYAQNPLKSTILVINFKYKTLDKRKKVYKEIEKNGILFESKKLYDNQVPEWINNFVKTKNRLIDPVSSILLTDFLGTNLGKIVNELEKLVIIVPENEKITPKIIEENIGISKDYNNFELQNAIMKKDILKANRIVNYFDKNPKDNPLVVTITSLFFFFSKILAVHYVKSQDSRVIAAELKVNPFFVKDYIAASKKYDIKKTVEIISYLREYDLKSKGVGSVSTTAGELLKELIFKILH